MRASFSIAIVGFFALDCGGCILPVPHTRVHAFGVIGQVVNATDHSPVRSASIASIDEPTQTAIGDRTGGFRLHARRGWHGAYFIGPISLSLLPDWDLTAPERDIGVSAPGYVPQIFAVRSYPASGSNVLVGQKIGAYLRVGQLEITPQPRGFPERQYGVANGTRPIRSETNRTSSAAGSRRGSLR